MNTETEIFRGYGKMRTLAAQTAVECRFGQEVETVVAATASVSLIGAETGNGEVRYRGKVHFFLVYSDAEKRVCRAEKGVEFTARAEDEECFPALTARTKVTVENLAVRREGASVYCTALLGADIRLYGDKSFEYLTGGELVIKREPLSVLTAHLCGGEAEAVDEFETEFIGDILLHTQTVGGVDVLCSAGTLRAEGEVNLGILALKGDSSLVSFERLVPFEIEIPCEEAAIGRGAEVRVSVLDAKIGAETDEERGKCKITAELTLGVEGCVYEEVTVDVATDAFSRTHEVTLSFDSVESTGAGEITRITERVSGKAALSSKVDFSDVMQAVTLQRAEANLVAEQDGKRVEGVALATLIVRGADGDRRGVEMSLPFSVPVEAEGGTVGVMVCSMTARQRQEGEIDAEATLKISIAETRTLTGTFVSKAEEGKEVRESDSAISVYIPRAGDGLWELSKSLKKSPEEVLESNPELEFPIKEGQRVVIYRQKHLA